MGRPLKVYAASEVGIRNVLSQYKENVGNSVTSALDAHIKDELVEANEKAHHKVVTISEERFYQ